MLPKVQKKNEHPILAQHTQEEILQELNILIKHFTSAETLEETPDLINEFKVCSFSIKFFLLDPGKNRQRPYQVHYGEILKPKEN